MSELKPKGKMGGRRPGAGRKPDYLKRLGLTPLTAVQHLARHDEGKIWDALLHHKSPDVRLKTLIYLTDLSDEELATLEGLTRKLLPAVPDAPENQTQSTSHEAEISSPLPEPEERIRETTFPMANGNGLRTQPTEAGQTIEISDAEPQPDGAA